MCFKWKKNSEETQGLGWFSFFSGVWTVKSTNKIMENGESEKQNHQTEKGKPLYFSHFMILDFIFWKS